MVNNPLWRPYLSWGYLSWGYVDQPWNMINFTFLGTLDLGFAGWKNNMFLPSLKRTASLQLNMDDWNLPLFTVDMENLPWFFRVWYMSGGCLGILPSTSSPWKWMVGILFRYFLGPAERPIFREGFLAVSLSGRVSFKSRLWNSMITLPKFNSSPLKSYPPKRWVVFQPSIFRGELLNFRWVFFVFENHPPDPSERSISKSQEESMSFGHGSILALDEPLTIYWKQKRHFNKGSTLLNRIEDESKINFQYGDPPKETYGLYMSTQRYMF